MDPNALPFDAETILAGLRSWVEVESPTYDAGAVNRMMDAASRDLALLGARIERIAGRMGFGDCVRARFPQPALGGGVDGPGILLMSHLDTVHPVGTGGASGPLTFRRDGDKAWGPGLCDMKGGTYAAFEALRVLARAGSDAALVCFAYGGQAGEGLYVPDSWLRLDGPDMRSAFRARIAWNVLPHSFGVYPRWLCEVDQASFTAVLP